MLIMSVSLQDCVHIVFVFIAHFCAFGFLRDIVGILHQSEWQLDATGIWSDRTSECCPCLELSFGSMSGYV